MLGVWCKPLRYTTKQGGPGFLSFGAWCLSKIHGHTNTMSSMFRSMNVASASMPEVSKKHCGLPGTRAGCLQFRSARSSWYGPARGCRELRTSLTRPLREQFTRRRLLRGSVAGGSVTASWEVLPQVSVLQGQIDALIRERRRSCRDC